MESRCGRTESILGKGIVYLGIPHKIEFVFTWLTFVLISVGVISMIKKYKSMVAIPETKVKHLKPDFLKTKFSIEYLVLTLICAGLLVIMVALLYISEGYDIKRLYTMILAILSVVFILGGIMLSKPFFFFTKRKPVLKEKQKGEVLKVKENDSQVRAYLIILLVLIPYFMCITGTMYQIFGVPHEITLSSEGVQYNAYHIYDQESYATKWLGDYAETEKQIYTDFYGDRRLVSQGKIAPPLIDFYWLLDPKRVDGYIYLRYHNVVNDELFYPFAGGVVYNMTGYQDLFTKKSEIYDSGCSKIYL